MQIAGVVKSLHERYQRTTQLVHDLDDIDEGIPYADKAMLPLQHRLHAATRQANAPSLADPMPLGHSVQARLRTRSLISNEQMRCHDMRRHPNA